MTVLPRVADYRPHRTVPDIDLEGHVVPGLTGEFFRRPDGDRVATVGLYRYRGAELFMAWGFVGEAHCRWTAYRGEDGWTAPHEGCPRVRREAGTLLVDTGRARIALPVQAASPEAAWPEHADARPGPAGSDVGAVALTAVHDGSHPAVSGSLCATGAGLPG
ncbi:hypothetical protein Cs7R123_23490 [Catellatospora sp. TT07R-123]|uniref:hypothetical protein n=1 Tax=Catellatospora sp. TT07R-123 TaxID=2733863 RepID=UPI001B149952|nr:hypothetical protein [Catellatospora sp. TT07R-123]GHJ45007.1 hypothetical protein Cs7R123_23490 [Catellatospora sp. TT07R-123]